jgi:hypothetical protein
VARTSARLDRRTFIKSSAVALAAAGLAGRMSAIGSPAPIADVLLDLSRIHKWNDANGDTWDPFWADDDNLYAFNCDGRGFGSNPMNIAFNKLAGQAPNALVGSQVNAMPEYGIGSQKGPDNATWKACGQECIDGAFYAFVSRNTYGNDSHDPLTRQTALNASLIKSTDRGRTWTPSAQRNYDHPMWPGGSFGTPFFVHYGRNGGQVERDGASKYVYACSTNGFWNDGDTLILGRVLRSQLPHLNNVDWEYLSGSDGSAESSWSGSIDRAIPILERPARCGQTPITFVHELGVYLLVSWYNTQTMTRWFEPNRMRYDFYQAPHPWGPWIPAGSADDSFLGPGWHMYGPSICAAFQQRRGDDIELSLFTSGCPFGDVRTSPYKMWRVPLLLKANPLPSSRFVPATDSEIRYTGMWFPWTTSQDPSGNDLPQATQSKGASAEFGFIGTGIDYVGEKAVGLGEVDVFLNGEEQGTTSLLVDDFPVLLGVALYTKQGLVRGKHTLKIVCRSDARINLEGFRVYA